MAAPADSSTTTTSTTGQDEAAVKSTKPLPRAIQTVMTISSLLEPSSTTASTETIGEHGVFRFLAWMKLVFFPFMFIAVAVLTYYALDDDEDDDDEVSSSGGFVFLAVRFLPHVYLAVVQAAGGYLDLFAPQTPYAAWVALYKVGFKSMGGAVLLASFVASGLYALMQCKAWLLLVACAYLEGLLVLPPLPSGSASFGPTAAENGERRTAAALVVRQLLTV